MSGPLPDFTGAGVLGGAGAGITTVAGVPVKATVSVYWQDPGDAEAAPVFVASTASLADGSWRIDGLNPDLPYLVVGSKPYFDDVAVAGCYPYRPPEHPPITGPYTPPPGAGVWFNFTD